MKRAQGFIFVISIILVLNEVKGQSNFVKNENGTEYDIASNSVLFLSNLSNTTINDIMLDAASTSTVTENATGASTSAASTSTHGSTQEDSISNGSSVHSENHQNTIAVSSSFVSTTEAGEHNGNTVDPQTTIASNYYISPSEESTSVTDNSVGTIASKASSSNTSQNTVPRVASTTQASPSTHGSTQEVSTSNGSSMHSENHQNTIAVSSSFASTTESGEHNGNTVNPPTTTASNDYISLSEEPTNAPNDSATAIVSIASSSNTESDEHNGNTVDPPTTTASNNSFSPSEEPTKVLNNSARTIVSTASSSNSSNTSMTTGRPETTKLTDSTTSNNTFPFATNTNNLGYTTETLISMKKLADNVTVTDTLTPFSVPRKAKGFSIPLINTTSVIPPNLTIAMNSTTETSIFRHQTVNTNLSESSTKTKLPNFTEKLNTTRTTQFSNVSSSKDILTNSLPTTDVKISKFDYVVKDETNKFPCIRLNITIDINISYKKTDKTMGMATLVVPKNASINGTCSKNTSQLMFTWKSMKTNENRVTLNFVNDCSKSSLDSIDLQIYFDEKTFPDATELGLSASTGTSLGLLSSTINSGHYICEKTTDIDEGNLSINIRNVSLIASNKEHHTNSIQEEKCAAKTGIVIVAVVFGVISGIVIVSLTSIYLFRRKSNTYNPSLIP